MCLAESGQSKAGIGEMIEYVAERHAWRHAWMGGQIYVQYDYALAC